MKYEIKGADGKLLVYEDRVVITKKSFVKKGKIGERNFFYSDISSVEFKKSGMTGGYIKFIVAGANETSESKSLIKLNKIYNRFDDQNSISFKALEKKDKEAYDFIMSKIAEAKKGNGGSVIQQSSNLDEIKKLAELKEMGAISESEFEEQKNKLLNN